MKFSEEQMKKAKACKTVDEFKEMAKAEGFNFSEEEAKTYFNATRTGELNDEDLDNIAGGKGRKFTGATKYAVMCPFCSRDFGIDLGIFDNGGETEYEPSRDQCDCGAKIRFNGGGTGCAFDFYKDGEKREGISLK